MRTLHILRMGILCLIPKPLLPWDYYTAEWAVQFMCVSGKAMVQHQWCRILCFAFRQWLQIEPADRGAQHYIWCARGGGDKGMKWEKALTCHYVSGIVTQQMDRKGRYSARDCLGIRLPGQHSCAIKLWRDIQHGFPSLRLRGISVALRWNVTRLF